MKSKIRDLIGISSRAEPWRLPTKLHFTSDEGWRDVNVLCMNNAERQILFNPKYRDYEFVDEIQNILKRGRWIDQESFDGVLKGRGGKGSGK